MNELSSNIELLNDKIAFRFIEDISNNNFKAVSKSGIIIAEKPENQVGKARWAQVLTVGPEVCEVKAEDYVLVEPLRWTTGLNLDEVGFEFWITDEKSVMAISEEMPE